MRVYLLLVCSMWCAFGMSVAQDAATHRQGALRLGATLPLSGEFISYGRVIQRGLELAAQDLRQHGTDLTMHYEDIPLPGAGAISAIRKLIDVDKIDALVANFWNPAMVAMAPVINRNGLVAVHSAAADDVILGSSDHIYAFTGRIRDEAEQLATYAWKTLEAKRAAIIYVGTVFGQAYAEHFRSRFEGLGGQVVYFDLTSLGNFDFLGELTRVKGGNPDVIMAGYFGTMIGTLVRQAQQLGITAPILGTYESDDESARRAAGMAWSNLHYFVPRVGGNREEPESFERRYRDLYGEPAPVLARSAYEGLVALAPLLVDCIAKPACVTKRLAAGMNGSRLESDGAVTRDYLPAGAAVNYMSRAALKRK